MVPALFIVCGQVGSGKTATAKVLSELVGAPVDSVE
jgi:predicted kinase